MSLSRIRKPTLIVLSLLLASGLLFSEPARTSVYADTSVGGPIISNTTWTLANSPYIAIASVQVMTGVTLTIEPGVVVKFQQGKILQVDGALVARGTPSKEIIFTSAKPNPSAGDWGNIQFSASAAPTTMAADGSYIGGSVIEHCTIEYAGGGASSALVARSLLINQSSLRNNRTRGIHLTGTATKPGRVAYTTVVGHSTPGGYGAGIYAEYSTIVGNLVAGNAEMNCGGGIYAYQSMVVNNYVSNNTSRDGGGIYAESSSVIGNQVSHNSARNYGGGVVARASTVSDNIITNNYADDWGAASTHGLLTTTTRVQLAATWF